MVLSFDEFRAIQRRRDGDKKEAKEETEASSSFEERAASFAETLEVQSMVSALIVLDLVASTANTSYSNLTRLVDAFTGFTVFLFFFELLALASAFGPLTFLRHPGYALDSVVVGLCLHAEITTGGRRQWRLLNFARLWRLWRLNDTMVSEAKRETEKAQADALFHQETLLKEKIEKVRLENALQEASASRKRLEAMCRAYKDEIDTLNEALAIAAMDIADSAVDLEENESELRRDDDLVPPQPIKIRVDQSGAYEQVAAEN